MSMLARRNNSAELDAFEALCRRLAGFDASLGFEFVDGYLSGLAVLPTWPPPDDWIVDMTEDAFERAFADPPDRAQALRVLDNRLAVLRDQLNPEVLADTPDWIRLEPLLAAPAEELTDKGFSRWPLAMSWAGGCICALEYLEARIGPVADEALRAEYEEHLNRIDDLTRLDRDAEDAAAREERLDAALFSLQQLRLWALDTLPKITTRRVETQPGRNDLCPCGSGRKYKKCHGAAA